MTGELKKIDKDVDYPALLELAIKSKEVDVDKLERIADLVHRAEDRRAHAMFNEAFSRFHDECPIIVKNKDARIATKSGAGYGYSYADLPSIANTIKEPLRNNNLSYSWDSKTVNGVLSCTCTLVHVGGHSRSSTFECPTDSVSGASAAQKHGAALTYAQRQSLKSVLGLTSCDDDIDGAVPHVIDPKPEQKPPTITIDQANELNDLIIEKGASKDRLMNYYQVTKLSELTDAQYKHATAELMNR